MGADQIDIFRLDGRLSVMTTQRRLPKIVKAAGNAEPGVILDDLREVSVLQLEPEASVDGVLVDKADMSGCRASSVRFNDMGLRSVDLSSSDLRGLRFSDVLGESVNAANASWRGVQMRRVTFDSSTLVGIDLAESALTATTFSACKLDLANLRMSTIEDVVFVGCSLREADLLGATLRTVRFAGCDLESADFTKATLEMVDVRTSNIGTIRGVASLKGAIVDGSQLIDLAPALAVELGIRVERPDDDDEID
jgi:uncharacterized protein YjbI with pentapeptide repeats